MVAVTVCFALLLSNHRGHREVPQIFWSPKPGLLGALPSQTAVSSRFVSHCEPKMHCFLGVAKSNYCIFSGFFANVGSWHGGWAEQRMPWFPVALEQVTRISFVGSLEAEGCAKD